MNGIPRVLSQIRASFGLAVCMSVVACGADHTELDDVAEVQQGLVQADRFYTDGSGKVSIVVRTCDWPSSYTTGLRCAYCAVDDDYVMVGGGAEIQYANQANTGASLLGSFPFPNSLNPPQENFGTGTETCVGNSPDNDVDQSFIAWAARSNGVHSHKLRAYVIGMKIQDYTTTELRNVLIWGDETSSPSLAPSWQTTTNPGNVIGGGANMLANSAAYLTESRPVGNGDAWRAAGVSANGVDAGIKVYHLTNFGLDLKVSARQASGAATSGFGNASVNVPYPWVVTSIGGRGLPAATFNGSRTLREIEPVVGGSQGALATTSDQAGSTVTSATTAYALNVYVDQFFAPWSHNTLQSADFGTYLMRASGPSPARLRESTTAPTANSTRDRWYMEPMPNSRYRLRNANPSSPAQGECAYRSGSQVWVGPCGTSNSYLWTYTTFQFQNVASGTCLNPTGSNSDLNLAACQSYGAQLFVPQAVNWPL